MLRDLENLLRSSEHERGRSRDRAGWSVCCYEVEMLKDLENLPVTGVYIKQTNKLFIPSR